VVERLFSRSPETSEALYRLAQAARECKRASEELRLCPPLSGSGEAAWYKIAVGPLDLGGPAHASLWSVTDVTHERARQEQVFQELRHAIDFLDHAPAGFFSCDGQGNISYMNATLGAWLGCDPAEAGRGELKLPGFVAGDGAALVACLARADAGGSAQQFDVDLKCRNGQILPARLIHGAVSGQNGAACSSRTLVLKRDAAAEPHEDLRAAEPRFARVFNATPMAIAIVDRNGRITRWNAAFARLMPEALKPQGDGGSRSIFAGILSRDHGAVDAALAAAFRSAPDVPPVDAGLTGEGDRSARLFFAAADEHDAESATIYALDTTEQRALQSNFAQSQKMQAIGQLAGGVAHDFNNVLTAIIGHCDLLLANHRPTDPAFRDINQIKQNANRAASLVRQLLAFSRRQTLRPQVLQLGDVLSDLQMLMRRLVGEKIDLELRHGRDLWLVEADVNQLEHVLVNLIVNARDAMPQGGKIILRTRNIAAAECAKFNEPSLSPGDYVEIEVEDFGHGIPLEVKDKIFEPFFTTKDVGKGTGLGLAMVYGIIKQTGGYVFCSSTVGKGTVFSILLPRYVADESRPARAIEQTQAPSADLTGRGTILLVEDEESVRAFGARALASRGYTVLQASSGIEALQIVEQNNGNIDLVVSDVVMPEMDGPTMFGELRKRGVKAKVIFVSGYAEDAFAKNLPEGEDFSFLPKPFTLKQLIEAVKGKQ
jgi:two-component system cell cycle sensor histidine kinase/response regulator CckA